MTHTLPPGARWAIRVAHHESTRHRPNPRVRPTVGVVRVYARLLERHAR